MQKDKPIIFSGIKATGIPTLGTFMGAIRNWNQLSADYRCLYCVVDLHSITVRLNPKEFRENARQLLAWFIASGLDPVENILYFQSHVPAHAELAWILNCFTYVGELNRMTQFKDKSAKNADNINAGLYTYPVLMAADILLYQTNLVPVGEDQRQHLELARDVAQRFNSVYGDVFTVPEAFIATVGARIMGLQIPEKKMSKSESENDNDLNLILASDTPDEIRKKFKKAVTDSDTQVRFAADKPGISNLLTIYACAKGITIPQAETVFASARYGEFKMAVGEAVVEYLTPVQEKFAALMADTAYLDDVMTNNANRARTMAEDTLARVKDVMGFMR